LHLASSCLAHCTSPWNWPTAQMRGPALSSFSLAAEDLACKQSPASSCQSRLAHDRCMCHHT
jgi:hypothetical protein